MKYTVSDEIRKQATKCVHGYSCLENGTCGMYPMCKPLSSIDSPLLRIDENDFFDCRYRYSFGYGEICRCPVRKEIRKQQN